MYIGGGWDVDEIHELFDRLQFKQMNAQTIVGTVGPIPTSCAFGHWVCPRGPFCSQNTLIKETEITGEICFNITHLHHHCSNRPRYSCCIFHLPNLQLRLYNKCGIYTVYMRIYLNRILICNRSLQIKASDPIEYVERNVQILFYFSLFMKCKKYS